MSTREISLREERLATPIGTVVLLTDEHENVRVLDFSDFEQRMTRLLDRHYGGRFWSIHPTTRTSLAATRITAYFDGDVHAIDTIDVATGGTSFQRQIWSALRKVPVGSPQSYGALARLIGRPNATRAVGLANGANPIGIIVPCHRIIGSNGALTGYGGGLERKRWLLDHEERHTAAVGMPQRSGNGIKAGNFSPRRNA